MATCYDATLDSEEEIEVFPEHERDPDDDNLIVAVLKVVKICKNAGLKCGVMGGMALKILGMTRSTVDVDVVIEAGSREIFRAFEGERCVYIPQSRIVDRVVPIRIGTGPPHCKSDYRVKVDLCMGGVRRGGMAGTPATLTGNRMEVNVEYFGYEGIVEVLAPEYLFATKLRAFAQRGRRRDVGDIVWLMENYSDDIVASEIFHSQTVSIEDQIMFLHNFRGYQGERKTRALCETLEVDYDEFFSDEEEERVDGDDDDDDDDKEEEEEEEHYIS